MSRDQQRSLHAHVGVIACLAVYIALLSAAGNAEAAEAQTHFFNATLSLTGDCSVSSVDTVSDPGCTAGSTCPSQQPPSGFDRPRATAVDRYGDRFVASFPASNTSARIDVFNSSGCYLTTLTEAGNEIRDPRSIAVDSMGILYVLESGVEESRLLVYTPTVYQPEEGEIAYEKPSRVLDPFPSTAIAVNPVNDHLFSDVEATIEEYGSAGEGNPLIDPAVPDETGPFENPFISNSHFFALDSAHERLYVNSTAEGTGLAVVRVYSLEGPTYPLLRTIEGFASEPRDLSLAVDEKTGHLFVADVGGNKKRIDEIEETGAPVSTIEKVGLEKVLGGGALAVDNAPTSLTQGYLFVPSGSASPSHSFAFEPVVGPPPAPLVETLTIGGLTENEGVLKGEINPEGALVTYRIDYLPQTQYEEQGSFAMATVAGQGAIPAGTESIAVSAPALGLAPDTKYRFRILAESAGGSAESQMTFSTYAVPDASINCGNQGMRSGPSFALPDCRAYELVSPPNTNGHAPVGSVSLGIYFQTLEASPDGSKVSFMTMGGAIPGLGGNGAFAGTPYLAYRAAGAWQTISAGPDGTEAEHSLPGSTSADQTYSFWQAENAGTLVPGGQTTRYLRYPDGHSEPIGRGKLGTDPLAEGELISEEARHVLFTSTAKLEEGAPAAGIMAIYDRQIDPVTDREETHVLSLLPGDVPPALNAIYQGASLNGEGVGFKLDEEGAADPLFLRHKEITYSIGSNLMFEGVAAGGSELFYLKEGDLFRFDAGAEIRTRFSENADVIPVQVSADGTTAYFISQQKLTGEANPSGMAPVAGGDNLYRSSEGQIEFIGTVTAFDVSHGGGSGDLPHGLGTWQESLSRGTTSTDPSRTNPDGSVLLFESRASLTSYDSSGHTEIYRYDAQTGNVTCISCNPTGLPAVGGASLQSVGKEIFSPEPFDAHAYVDNLRDDGRRVFFQSTEPLVATDTDGVQDVYEWEEQGVGSCRSPGGCVYVISSGHSPRVNYLYGVSNSGDDVFLISSDLLEPAVDQDETPSIYDAKVEGGFAPPASPPGECLGEACQPAAKAPADPTPASAVFEGSGNVKGTSHCKTHKGRERKRTHCGGKPPRKHHQKKHHRLVRG